MGIENELSENDIRHHMTFSGVYELPFGPKRQWLSAGLVGKIVGGWSLSNTSSVQSGPPVAVVTQTVGQVGHSKRTCLRNGSVGQPQRTGLRPVRTRGVSERPPNPDISVRQAATGLEG